MLFFKITFYAIYNIKRKDLINIRKHFKVKMKEKRKGGAGYGILGKAEKVWESERYIKVWK